MMTKKCYFPTCRHFTQDFFKESENQIYNIRLKKIQYHYLYTEYDLEKTWHVLRIASKNNKYVHIIKKANKKAIFSDLTKVFEGFIFHFQGNSTKPIENNKII